MGAALFWNGRTGLKTVTIAFLLSSCIELTQTVIPGRDPSLGDVTFNTLGAGAGLLGALLARRWLVPPVSSAARLSLVAGALAVGVVALTGVLLAPAFPNAALRLWYAPDLPEMPWYHARVLSTRLGGLATHPGILPARSRELLEAGEPLFVEAIAGPRVPALGPLLAIEDLAGEQLYLIGPDRDDLVLRYQTRAATWGLDQPDIRLRGAFGRVARGDSIRIGVRRRASGWCLSLNRVERCGLAPTAGAAWAMVLYPRHWPAWAYVLLGALWVGGLAFPVGLWTRRRVQSALAVSLFATALALVPIFVDLGGTPPSEWCGAIAGFGTGLAFRAFVRHG